MLGDASCDGPGSKMRILYHKILPNGNLDIMFTSEIIDDYLEGNSIPGIGLDHWLDNANKHGLPVVRSMGPINLSYWGPRSSRVAKYGGAGQFMELNCFANPEESKPHLGVRPAMARKS